MCGSTLYSAFAHALPAFHRTDMLELLEAKEKELGIQPDEELARWATCGRACWDETARPCPGQDRLSRKQRRLSSAGRHSGCDPQELHFHASTMFAMPPPAAPGPDHRGAPPLCFLAASWRLRCRPPRARCGWMSCCARWAWTTWQTRWWGPLTACTHQHRRPRHLHCTPQPRCSAWPALTVRFRLQVGNAMIRGISGG